MKARGLFSGGMLSAFSKGKRIQMKKKKKNVVLQHDDPEQGINPGNYPFSKGTEVEQDAHETPSDPPDTQHGGGKHKWGDVHRKRASNVPPGRINENPPSKF